MISVLLAIKNWLIKVMLLYVSFVAAAFSQSFYSVIEISNNHIGRDLSGLFLAALFIGIVLLARFFALAKFAGRPQVGSIDFDIGFAIFFFFVCIVWIYFPQSEGFSFGDGNSEIVHRGVITSYGHQVKIRNVLSCGLASTFYVVACLLRLKIRNRVQQSHKSL